MWSDRLPDYSVSGHSDTTIYLLHGLYGSQGYWKFVTRRLLDRGLRVIAWDAPGYGQSPPDDNYSLMGAARSCARLIAKTGSATNIILGQSMGGQIAMRTSRQVPGLISAVIICATLGYPGNKTPEEQKDFVASRELSSTDDGDLIRKNMSVVASMMANGASGPDVELVKAVGAETPRTAIQSSIKAIMDAPDSEAIESLRSIRVPALFIAGGADKVGHPTAMQRLASLVENSEFQIVNGAGHYPWAELPDEFFDKLDPFLDSIVKSRIA